MSKSHLARSISFPSNSSLQTSFHSGARCAAAWLATTEQIAAANSRARAANLTGPPRISVSRCRAFEPKPRSSRLIAQELQHSKSEPNHPAGLEQHQQFEHGWHRHGQQIQPDIKTE